jgi:N-acyl-D-aspartate/D-glutamate deacylase
MKEVFEIARRANIPAEIWHFKTAYKKNWGRMPEMLGRIAAARRRGLKITADVYPYVAGSTSLSACLPPWTLEGGTDKMVARLKDPPTPRSFEERNQQRRERLGEHLSRQRRTERNSDRVCRESRIGAVAGGSDFQKSPRRKTKIPSMRFLISSSPITEGPGDFFHDE